MLREVFQVFALVGCLTAADFITDRLVAACRVLPAIRRHRS